MFPTPLYQQLLEDYLRLYPTWETYRAERGHLLHAAMVHRGWGETSKRRLTCERMGVLRTVAAALLGAPNK